MLRSRCVRAVLFGGAASRSRRLRRRPTPGRRRSELRGRRAQRARRRRQPAPAHARGVRPRRPPDERHLQGARAPAVRREGEAGARLRQRAPRGPHGRGLAPRRQDAPLRAPARRAGRVVPRAGRGRRPHRRAPDQPAARRPPARDERRGRHARHGVPPARRAERPALPVVHDERRRERHAPVIGRVYERRRPPSRPVPRDPVVRPGGGVEPRAVGSPRQGRVPVRRLRRRRRRRRPVRVLLQDPPARRRRRARAGPELRDPRVEPVRERRRRGRGLRVGVPEPLPHLARSGDGRAVGRRRRPEQVGGDQPRPPRWQLRLALPRRHARLHRRRPEVPQQGQPDGPDLRVRAHGAGAREVHHGRRRVPRPRARRAPGHLPLRRLRDERGLDAHRRRGRQARRGADQRRGPTPASGWVGFGEDDDGEVSR